MTLLNKIEAYALLPGDPVIRESCMPTAPLSSGARPVAIAGFYALVLKNYILFYLILNNKFATVDSNQRLTHLPSFTFQYFYYTVI